MSKEPVLRQAIAGNERQQRGQSRLQQELDSQNERLLVEGANLARGFFEHCFGQNGDCL